MPPKRASVELADFLAEGPNVRTSSFTFAMKVASATSASNFDALEMEALGAEALDGLMSFF
jgi:hypothetical protein